MAQLSKENTIDFGGLTLVAKDIITGVTRPSSTNSSFKRWRVVEVDGTGVSLTGSTAETVLKTITVPGKSLGPNGIMKISLGWTVNNDASNKTVRLRFTSISGDTILGITTNSNNAMNVDRILKNNNSESAQVMACSSSSNGFGSSATLGTHEFTVDTSADFDLVVTGQLADAADNITLVFVEVETLYVE